MPLLNSIFATALLVLTSNCQSIFTNAKSNEASLEYLTENAKNPDVTTLPSGLQYKILRTGNGQHHPEHDSPTECHYKGTLIDQKTVFDSSYDRGEPAVFQPRQVIKGWTEAMQLMVEGDKWELYIPSDLGYGDEGSSVIMGGDALIFTMEMIKIVGTKVPDKYEVRCNVKTARKCNEKETRYVESAKNKFSDDAKIEKEIDRIKRISINGADSVVDWSNRRIRILNQLKEDTPNTEL
jgi:FKBP-type peptidyl-prolyl cis-trans isomerase FklB